MGIIKRTIKHKEAWIMVSLYKTLVRPHVECCVSAWSPYYKQDKVQGAPGKGSTQVHKNDC